MNIYSGFSNVVTRLAPARKVWFRVRHLRMTGSDWMPFVDDFFFLWLVG
jgi:hypothetical protein